MKRFLFIIIILALIGTGVYALYKKSGNTEIGSGEIAPYGQWASILPGEWDFRTIIKSPQVICLFEGEVEFLQDSSFKRFITFKYYINPDQIPVEMEDKNCTYTTGGSIIGKWSLQKPGTWTEIIDKCNIALPPSDGYNKPYDVCEIWFSKEGMYGNTEDDFSKYELQEVTKNRIIIKGRTFNDGAERIFTFKRKKR